LVATGGVADIRLLNTAVVYWAQRAAVLAKEQKHSSWPGKLLFAQGFVPWALGNMTVRARRHLKTSVGSNYFINHRNYKFEATEQL
jgi:hypothetical protein